MFEFVFLDLDDTILDFEASEKSALGRALADFGIALDEGMAKRYNVINAEHWARLETGELTRDEVKLYRFVQLIREYGLPADAEKLRSLYEEKLAHEVFFVDGARELLDRIKGRAKLYLLSNGTKAVQAGRIAGAGIAPYFEEIFISEEIGFVKPQRELFDACFARIPGFDRERAVILGDSLSSDIRGGINAQIRTCWFNPKGKPGKAGISPDYEIKRLDEFLTIL